jgi:hypothetical protein
MSSTGFRWFLAAVIAVLVAIMLGTIRANAAWPAHVPEIATGMTHNASGPLWAAAMFRPDGQAPG